MFRKREEWDLKELTPNGQDYKVTQLVDQKFGNIQLLSEEKKETRVWWLLNFSKIQIHVFEQLPLIQSFSKYVIDKHFARNWKYYDKDS